MSRGEHKMMRKDQRGFTIVELLIAVAILAIVIAAVCGFILVGSRSYASANSDISVQQEAQLALNQMSDVLIDTTRSVNYAGYDSSGRAVLALKDSEFGFEPVEKSLIMYNGAPVVTTAPGGTSTTTIEPGNGNKHYQFYWNKDDETLYYTDLDVQPDDVADPDNVADPMHKIKFPDFGDPGWVVLAEHVTKFEVDLTQVEEKRVVQLELTFVNGKREYNTSNNVTIRNKVGVNDAEIGPLDRSKTLSVIPKELSVILEPGETFHFSTPKVSGQNVTDKSVTWEMGPGYSGSSSFIDSANGILQIATDEPAGSFTVIVKTNAKDSEGRQAQAPVTVQIKRVSAVDLGIPGNSTGIVETGSEFTVQASVDGNCLGLTCDGCGDPTTKDYDVVHQGAVFNWEVVEGADYVTIEKSDVKSAEFKVKSTATAGATIRIRATSYLSTVKSYEEVHGYLVLTIEDGENAEPINGSLKYGEETLLKEIVEDLSTEGHKYMTAVRVVDNSGNSPDRILLYFTTGEGADYRVAPDLFDLDLNGSYTFYMQAIDPVSKENHKLGNHHQSDSNEVLWQEYYNNVKDKKKPYGYDGDKYDYRKVYYSVLDKPKLTFDYKGISYKGKNITYDPVNVYSVSPGGSIISGSNLQPTGYENIVGDNSVWNKMTFSFYKGKESELSQWQGIYYFDKETMSYHGNTTLEGGAGVLNIGGNPFLKMENGDKLKLCGNYHIVPGMLYQNKKSDRFQIIGWAGFNFEGLERKERYYEFDDSTIHVNITSEFTMDIDDDQFKGQAMFPLPSQMSGNALFPNLSNTDWQTSAGEVKVDAMRTGNSYTEELKFDYVRYRYIPRNNTYEVEPIQIRKRSSDNKLVIHSYGIYICEENGIKWQSSKSIADKELNFNVKQFEYNGGQYQTYFPLPEEEGFPFVNGIEQTSYRVSLYDNNLENKANLSGVTVTCKQTGDTYEIKFTRKVKDQNPDNHMITIVPCGTYTWSPEKTEWKKTGTDNIEYDTDLEVNLEDLAGKGNGNGKSYKTYFPLPTESDFPFKGAQGKKENYKPVAYEMSDQYGKTPEKNMSYTVEYKKTGDTYQIEFVDRQGPNGDNHKITIKSYGAYTWKQGDKEWTKITSQDRFECDLDVNLEGLVLNGQSCKMRFPLPHENDFKSMFRAPGAEIENSGPAIYLEGDTYCENRKWNYDFGGNIKIKYELVGTDEHRITFFYAGWSNNVHTSSTFKCKDGDTEWTEVP